jgi:hypothetical protein
LLREPHALAHLDLVESKALAEHEQTFGDDVGAVHGGREENPSRCVALPNRWRTRYLHAGSRQPHRVGYQHSR